MFSDPVGRVDVHSESNGASLHTMRETEPGHETKPIRKKTSEHTAEIWGEREGLGGLGGIVGVGG